MDLLGPAVFNYLLDRSGYLVDKGQLARSGLASLANLVQAHTASFPSVEPSPGERTIDQILSGQGFDTGAPAQAYVTRELPYGSDIVFNTPMDDFLRYGGRDDDAGGRYYMAPSYGQTDQPATEVRFDQPPGGANGGLAALIRRGYAKR